jgi:hypothetical protein
MSIASRLPRPAWFEIDLDAAAENLRSVRRLRSAELCGSAPPICVQ